MVTFAIELIKMGKIYFWVKFIFCQEILYLLPYKFVESGPSLQCNKVCMWEVYV